MPAGENGAAQPTRARMIFATIFVLVTVLAIWKLIDYRTQPPPPPHPIGRTP